MEKAASFSLVRKIVARIWVQALLLAVFLSSHLVFEILPETKHLKPLEKVSAFLGVWIGAWLVSRIVTVIRDAPAVSGKLTPNLRFLVFAFVRALVYVLGFLIALDSIGVSITPLLASLGVGSLAVGLALQDTLGNLFSGFYLYLDRPIAAGDWIRLESGVEGQVVRIGWRSTHLSIGQDNTVIIPNSKLSTSSLTNFSLPVAATNLNVSLGVSYDADLEKVEAVLLDIARMVAQEWKQFFSTEPAIVRFQKFGESSIDLQLTVKVRSFPDHVEMRHELIKAIKQRFAQEKIEIPFPQRVIRQVES
jgi:small-conductance mechanosensitive channel